MSPQRMQLSRAKGWRKPPGAIVVARPSKWGNPYRLRYGHHTLVDGWGHEYPCLPGEWRGVAVRKFREDIVDGRIVLDLEPLRGHDLACWCPLDQPCHADVLLDLANRDQPRPEACGDIWTNGYGDCCTCTRSAGHTGRHDDDGVWP